MNVSESGEPVAARQGMLMAHFKETHDGLDPQGSPD
jgi:hypothetical protein